MKAWTKTYSGKTINFLNPDPDQIDVRDIAHGLSHVCRFAGQIPRFYSVAEHCYRIWEQVKDISPEHGIWALLHDASEAYMCDVPKPLKNLLPQYMEIEKRLTKAIVQSVYQFIPLESVDDVYEIDKRMLKTEAIEFGFDVNSDWGYDDVDVIPVQKFYYWQPSMAEAYYIMAMKDSVMAAYKKVGRELPTDYERYRYLMK